jgi:hypothetical protein
MILRKPGECRIGKHQRAVENLVRMNDGRHEALDVAAVKNRLVLLSRMLMRVHGKNIRDARQLFRALIGGDRWQLEDVLFTGSDASCCCGNVSRRFQAGPFHRQAIVVFVGSGLGVRHQDDIVGVAKR